MNDKLTTISQAKKEAKQLRAELQLSGESISHSRSLELIAQRHGFRDWNTLSAAIASQAPECWVVGGKVRGKFRGHSFEAELLSLTPVRPGWFQVSLKLDQAVDVVSFESFSNFRHRVNGVVGPEGSSKEKTSDGQPHLILDM